MAFVDLTPKQLLLVSKLGIVIKKETGQHIDLTQDDLLNAIADAMRSISEAKALQLYQELLAEAPIPNKPAKAPKVRMSKEEKRKKRFYRGQYLDD